MKAIKAWFKQGGIDILKAAAVILILLVGMTLGMIAVDVLGIGS